jgi:hypothetical protein
LIDPNIKKRICLCNSLGKSWGAEVTAIHVIGPSRGVLSGRVKEKEKEREEEAERLTEDYLMRLDYRQRKKDLI